MHVTIYALDASGNEIPVKVDSSGNLTIGGGTTNVGGTALTKELRSSTAASTAIAAGTVSGTVLAANANRLGAALYNESTAVAYLNFGTAAASLAQKTRALAAAGYWEIPYGYTGVITGVWTAANGSVNVTEFSA